MFHHYCPRPIWGEPLGTFFPGLYMLLVFPSVLRPGLYTPLGMVVLSPSSFGSLLKSYLCLPAQSFLLTTLFTNQKQLGAGSAHILHEDSCAKGETKLT